MEYKVITAAKPGNGPEASLSALAERVNDAVRDGWTPLGSVSFPPTTDMAPGSTVDAPVHFIYACQAMVKG
jgi:hypothetical protein